MTLGCRVSCRAGASAATVGTARASVAPLAVAREARGNVGHAFADAGHLLRLDPQDDDARDVLDEIAYTTLVHVAWVVLVLLWVAAAFKGLA